MPDRPPSSEAEHGALGVCDWGIGGVGVLHALRQVGVDTPAVYLSDSGAVPYGKQRSDVLLGRLVQVADLFAGRGVSDVVLACNAASTVIEALRRARPGQRFIGMPQPTILSLSERPGTPLHIGILGGARTVRARVYRRGLTRAGHRVTQRVAQPLSAAIELGQHHTPAFRAVARRIVAPLRRCDLVVLACTHYPAATPVFAELLPGVALLDPAQAVAERVRTTWSLPAGVGETLWHTTGDVPAMVRAAALAFGTHLSSPQQVALD